MLTIIALAICLSMPVITYYFVSDEGSWRSAGECVLDVAVSLVVSMFFSAILLLLVLVPVTSATMGELSEEHVYTSPDVSMSGNGKTVSVVTEEGETVYSSADFAVRSSSDNPDIQSKLDAGETVVAIYVQSSSVTLIEKRKCVLFSSISPAAVMSLLAGNGSMDSGEEEAS